MTSPTIALARLQAGICEWCATSGATVVWAPSGYPRGAAGEVVIAARLLAGPDDDPIGGSSVQSVTLPSAATLTINSAPAGESVKLYASGRAFEYVIQVGDDVTAARDGLLAAIEDTDGTGPLVAASFEASGAASIAIDADEPGDLYGLRLRVSTPGIASLAIGETIDGLLEISSARSLVEIQAASIHPAPRNGAASVLARLLAARNLPTAAAIWDRYGLSPVGPPGRVVSLDALAGPAWQSRSAVTLYMAQSLAAFELVGTITRARATIEARGASADPITISIDVEPE